MNANEDSEAESHAGGTQMQVYQFQRLKIEDGLSYLDQLKHKFGHQPQVYTDFLDIMKEFKEKTLDTPGVIQRVSNLFRGHPELIAGFNTFLPLGYRIEVGPNEQAQVSIPGTNLDGGATSAPTLLTMDPAGSTTSTINSTHSSQSNHSSRSTSSHYFLRSRNAVNKASIHPTPVTSSQSHTNSENQNFPAHAQSSGGSPGPSRTPQTGQRDEFKLSINYVNKVKNRFQGQPVIYEKFLKILFTYGRQQINLKNGVHSVDKPMTEAELYAQVAKLFQNNDDLLQEFGRFLPQEKGVAENALVGLEWSNICSKLTNAGDALSDTLEQVRSIFPDHLVDEALKKISSRAFTLHGICEEILELKTQENRPAISDVDSEILKSKINHGSSSNDVLTCTVCMDKERSAVFQPCGHFASCWNCSNLLSNCPVCRRPVTHKIRTYVS